MVRVYYSVGCDFMNVKVLGAAMLLGGAMTGLAGCGAANPYQVGMDQFSNAVLSNNSSTVQPWTVYVAHGMVTTGRLWYRRQSPVLYAQIGNTSRATDAHIVIHFEGHTYGPTTLASGGFIAFYILSSQIPRNAVVSWTQHGRAHHATIPAAAMIDVTSSMSLP